VLAEVGAHDEVNYDHFVAVMKSFHELNGKPELVDAFKMFDHEDHGTVRGNELYEIMHGWVRRRRRRWGCWVPHYGWVHARWLLSSGMGSFQRVLLAHSAVCIVATLYLAEG